MNRFFKWLTTQESGGMPTDLEIDADRRRAQSLELQLHGMMRRVGIQPVVGEGGYLVIVPVLETLLQRIEELEARQTDGGK